MILTRRKHFLKRKETKRKMFVRIFLLRNEVNDFFNEIVEVLTNIELLKAVDFCVIHSKNNCKANLNKTYCR